MSSIVLKVGPDVCRVCGLVGRVCADVSTVGTVRVDVDTDTTTPPHLSSPRVQPAPRPPPPPPPM